MSAAQKVEQILAEHKGEGSYNSLDRLVVCCCGARVPYVSDDPHDVEAMEAGLDAHRAEQIVAALGSETVEYGVRSEDGHISIADSRARAERWATVLLGDGTLVTRPVLTGEWQEATDG